MKNNPFDDIIGQETAKRKLNFFLDGYKSTNMIPHFAFIAEKGAGKSSLGVALAKSLVPKDKTKFKPIEVINCASLGTMNTFIDGFILPRNFTTQDVTLFFDEASEIPREITMGLLSIVNPGVTYSEYNHEGQILRFDYNKITFMFATTESQKVYEPLMSRLERVDFEPYTIEQLGKILIKNTPDTRFESQELLDDIAGVVRSNPRQAAKLGEYINTFVRRRHLSPLKKSDWEKLKYILGIMPLGLSKIEVEIMRILNQATHCKLGHIAAKTGLTSATVQKDMEKFLIRNNLIKIEPEGRTLTNQGRNVLQTIEESKRKN